MAVQHEGERVLRALQPADRVVLLDERGRDVSSEDMARLLAQVGGRAGRGGCVLCVVWLWWRCLLLRGVGGCVVVGGGGGDGGGAMWLRRVHRNQRALAPPAGWTKLPVAADASQTGPAALLSAPVLHPPLSELGNSRGGRNAGQCRGWQRRGHVQARLCSRPLHRGFPVEPTLPRTHHSRPQTRAGPRLCSASAAPLGTPPWCASVATTPSGCQRWYSTTRWATAPASAAATSWVMPSWVRCQH